MKTNKKIMIATSLL